MLHILFHIDGDAFFASCEQSTNLQLRGRPIAVGKERGVATAFSYEAKKLGITRGMSGQEIGQHFPEVLLVSSDYRKYKIFSRRMNNIVRRYTSRVEQTSIDECYADMSQVVKTWQEAYSLAQRVQQELCTELGLTVSIGIGPNKTIAKIASGLDKPRGVSLLSPQVFGSKLYPLDISRVSGIGERSSARFYSFGIYTIADFVQAHPVWVQEQFSKPYIELHQELKGEVMHTLALETALPQSISKIRAFTPASADQELLRSEFARNAEIVSAKLAHNGLQARRVVFAMKIKRGGKITKELVSPRPITTSVEIMACLRRVFGDMHRPGYLYRATSIALYDLHVQTGQMALFDNEKQEQSNKMHGVEQELNTRFGRAALTTASSMLARRYSRAVDVTSRTGSVGTPLISTSDGRRILYLPYLGEI